MTAGHRAAAHHASAAIHHMHAMQFHREASRHYRVGKDYAHAAHQALVAHGHTLKAMDHWQKASDEYSGHSMASFPRHEGLVEQHGDPWAKYMIRLLAGSPEQAVTVAPYLSGVAHHVAAADHAGQAARHHGHASSHCDGSAFPLALQESQMAHDHALHSFFHGNEAARHHVEHCGRASTEHE